MRSHRSSGQLQQTVLSSKSIIPKKGMPTILTDNLTWEWLMEEPSEERLTEIALSQIPSKLMEACTIDKDYRFAGEATP